MRSKPLVEELAWTEISKRLHVQKGKRYEKTSKFGGEGKLTE